MDFSLPLHPNGHDLTTAAAQEYGFYSLKEYETGDSCT